MTAKSNVATPKKKPSEGVYFSRLTIENARCFRTRQTLDLTARDGTIARWTLLIGENGTGKTTLLQAMAAHAFDLQLQWAIPTEEKAHFAHYNRVARWRALTSAPRASEPHSAELRWLVGFLSKDEDERPSFIRSGGLGDVVWLESSLLMPVVCIAYGAYRRAGRELLTESAMPDAFTSLTEDKPLVNAEEWFLRRDYAANNPRNSDVEQAAAAASRDRVAAIACRVLPGVKRLVPVTLDAARGNTVLMAETAAGQVRLSELGLGYQSTLAWVVDLAARMMAAYPESENPLSEPAVVLIDEIDLHLHPKWQRTLLTELAQRFPNVQFIATAHSPLIVQAAPEANVAVLRREGDHVVIDRAPESVRNWRIDQILTSDLFGLPSARPAHLDAKYRRREEILRKLKPTAAERAELASLRDELGASPEGESRALLEAEEIMLALTRERTAIEKGAKPTAKPRPKAGAAPRRRRA